MVGLMACGCQLMISANASEVAKCHQLFMTGTRMVMMISKTTSCFG